MSIRSPHLDNFAVGKRASTAWSNEGPRGLLVPEGVRFQENGSTSLTGNIYLPKNSLLVGVFVYAVALWTDTGAVTLDVGLYDQNGTAIDADGIFAAVNLKATDLLANESLSFVAPGGKQGALLAFSDSTLTDSRTDHITRNFFPNGGEVRGVVSAANGDGSAGDTYLLAVHGVPQNIRNAA